MKFRKKPIVIEAEQFWPSAFPWPKGVYVTDIYPNGTVIETPKPGERPREFYHLDTAEGPLRVSEGDWIIRGIEGELYPVKPGIFDATYECVE